MFAVLVLAVSFRFADGHTHTERERERERVFMQEGDCCRSAHIDVLCEKG